MQRKTRDLRVAFLGSSLTVVSFLLLVSVISLIVLTSKTQTTQSPTSEALLSNVMSFPFFVPNDLAKSFSSLLIV